MRRLPLISLSAVAFCVGCGTARVPVTTQRDSVRIEVVERLVELHDTLTVDIPLVVECVVVKDSSSLENEYARSKAVILPNGELRHSLETIPQTIIQPIVSSHTIRDSITFHGQIITKVDEVERELTAWQSFRLKGFWVVSVVLLLIMLCRFI